MVNAAADTSRPETATTPMMTNAAAAETSTRQHQTRLAAAGGVFTRRGRCGLVELRARRAVCPDASLPLRAATVAAARVAASTADRDRGKRAGPATSATD